MTKQSPAMKPCPFCGGQAEVSQDIHEMYVEFSSVTATCSKCGASVLGDSLFSVAELWNRRTDAKAREIVAWLWYRYANARRLFKEGKAWASDMFTLRYTLELARRLLYGGKDALG